MNDLPVVVIGAGPQGLAAAAHLLERGLEPLVLESGATAAPAVAEWGHVRLFSAWPELVDAASVRLLEYAGKLAVAQNRSPGTGCPTDSDECHVFVLARVVRIHQGWVRRCRFW